MRKRLILIAFTIMAVLFTGCSKENVPSEGDVKTETKTVTVEKGMIPQVTILLTLLMANIDTWR